MKAIQVETLGNPARALNGPEASPVNQYDLMTIARSYGYGPQLPAIMGTEGAHPARALMRLHIHPTRSNEGGVDGQA
jgi:hypothetical protein